MKILIVTLGVLEDGIEGGVQREIFHLSRGLKALGHSVAILTRRASPEYPASEIRNGIAYYRFSLPKAGSRLYVLYPILAGLQSIYASKKAIEDFGGFDVIYYHHPFPAIGLEMTGLSKNSARMFRFYAPRWRELLIDSKGYRIPFITQFTQLVALIEKSVLRRVSLIVTTSNFMARQVAELESALADKIALVPIGVDTTRFFPASQEVNPRMVLDLPNDRFILLTVRRLVPRMGLEPLLTAMQIVVERNPNAILLIGGEGHLKDKLQQLVIDLNLQDYVKLLGFIPDSELVSYYQAADIFVLPTAELEGFGVVILESFAINTPVLGTPVGAIPEVIGEFNPKLVFRNRSPNGIADLILKAIENPADLELYQDYRATILRKYTWDDIITQHEELALRLIG